MKVAAEGREVHKTIYKECNNFLKNLLNFFFFKLVPTQMYTSSLAKIYHDISPIVPFFFFFISKTNSGETIFTVYLNKISSSYPKLRDKASAMTLSVSFFVTNVYIILL